tara:strand:+ start:264 stop:518 length:255 start_codon:yes stop_codon:yes gene_type:complete
MKQSCVVLSIKGWDGTTILGTYSSISEAKKAGHKYVTSGNNKKDIFDEEIILDVTTSSMLATSKEINRECEGKITVITKTHRYI